MNKYNDWCHKKPLVFPSKQIEDSFFEESNKILSLSISAFSKSALQQKKFLKVDGFEFVAFSNLKIDKNIVIENGLEFRPCFSPELGGRQIGDPIQKAEYVMHKRGRYLYDGWLPIKNWEPYEIANELRKIDGFISLFSMTGHVYFSWFPKYFHQDNKIEIIYADTKKEEKSIIDKVLLFQSHLDGLQTGNDKKVILTSINWINKAKETSDVIMKFLFYVLSIEQLVKNVEDSKSYSSFYKIRTHKDKKERKDWKRKCIKEKLKNIDFNDKPWTTIDDIYFSCNSGLKGMIKRQVTKAFKPDSYLQKISINDIYAVRSKIAHGSIDILNRDDIELVYNKIDAVEKLAINYVLSILYKCDINFSSGKLHASFGTDFESSFISNDLMYEGPTHMALRYYTMI